MRAHAKALDSPQMTKIDKAVLLAAGRGTRMRDLTAELPKPMIKVRNKPVLLHIIEGLQAAGIKDFLIVIGYRGDVVKEYFGDGTCFGLRIKYATQVVQDGTGRVVDHAREFVCDGSIKDLPARFDGHLRILVDRKLPLRICLNVG